VEQHRIIAIIWGVRPIESWAKDLMRSCRKRQRKNGIEVAVTLADVERLLMDSNGVCAVTGIPFDDAQIGQFRRRPFAPSLDRIECSKGYVPGNLRVVCVAVNYAMSDWGEDVLRRIAEAFYVREPLKKPWRKGLAGAVYRSKTNRYEARVKVNGRLLYFGTFKTEREAHEKSGEVMRALENGSGIESCLSPRQLRNLAKTSPGLRAISVSN
jgi:hypothetical protein